MLQPLSYPIHGSEDGFDGFKIGVNGFDNPLRDYKVKEFKAQIGAGCQGD